MCEICSKYPIGGKCSLKRKIHRAARYFSCDEILRFGVINCIEPTEATVSYLNENFSPPGIIHIDEWWFRILFPQQIAVVLYHELLHIERHLASATQIEDEVMAESTRWARTKGLRLPEEGMTRRQREIQRVMYAYLT